MKTEEGQGSKNVRIYEEMDTSSDCGRQMEEKTSGYRSTRTKIGWRDEQRLIYFESPLG